MELATIVLAAGEASANALALKGGMSIIDPTLITALFAGMASVITAIGTILWCKARASKKEEELRTHIANELRAKIVNDPLRVQKVSGYVTSQECAAHRCALSRRIDELGPALERIFKKLSENDHKSEERSLQMHRRLDPVIERVAAHGAEIDMLKQKK